MTGWRTTRVADPRAARSWTCAPSGTSPTASSTTGRPVTYSGHGMSLRQGFGRTETSPAVPVQVGRMALDKPGSARVPVLHNEARVVDEAGSVRS